MILDALYIILSPVASAYPLVGDIEAATPFVIFKAEPEVLRDKDGINGYEYTVSIGVIDPDPDAVDTLTESVKTAVLAVTGTVSGTTFEAVLFTNESGMYFLDTDQVYENDLEFLISTLNR